MLLCVDGSTVLLLWHNVLSAERCYSSHRELDCLVNLSLHLAQQAFRFLAIGVAKVVNIYPLIEKNMMSPGCVQFACKKLFKI